MWAKKKHNQPVEARCKACVVVLTESYAGTSWESMCLQVETAPEVKAGFFAARAVYAGNKSKTFYAESYTCGQSLSMIMERSYIFLTELQFLEVHGVHPRNLKGVVVEQVVTETGEVLKGVICADPDQPFRKIKTQHVLQTQRSDLLLEPSRQLRQGQSHAYAKWFEEDLLKKRPAGLKAALTEQQIKQMVAKTQEEAAESTAGAASNVQQQPIFSGEGGAEARR